MILNPFTVSYLLLSLLSLAGGLAAVGGGALTGPRWKVQLSPEAQEELEKKVALIITLVGMVLAIRFFMVPLWFWTLGSLIPSIPGAMCYTGVHQAGGAWTFGSTALKFLIPVAYGYWLVLNALDRQLPTQPFMRTKLLALVPAGLLLLLEAGLDARFLGAVEPRTVTCCTSIFDQPTENVPQVLTRSNWVWVVAFFGLSGTLIAALTWWSGAIGKRGNGETGKRGNGETRPPDHQTTRPPDHQTTGKRGLISQFPNFLSETLGTLGISGTSLVSLVCFVLALHTQVSPLLLNAPHHHCIFCLWQELPDMALCTAVVLGGLWAAFLSGLVGNLRGSAATRAVVMAAQQRLQTVARGALASGTVWLALRIGVKLLLEGGR